MPCPPYNCDGCGHPACNGTLWVHGQASPHVCNTRDCGCQAYVYPAGVEASDFEGGGGSSGGGGASGSW